MSQDAEKYRRLIPYLPSEMVLKDQITDCQRVRSEQTQRIENLRKFLATEKIIEDQPARLYKDECLLQAEWSGVFDFYDKPESPEKVYTKPSVGWTCQPLECHIEGDLPVPYDKKDLMTKEVTMMDKCCVDISHIHDHAEAHVHVICKGVHPNDLGWKVNQLVKLVLEHRGHELHPLEMLKH